MSMPIIYAMSSNNLSKAKCWRVCKVEQ